MSKVFLSYSRSDEDFAIELYHRLTRDGVECFFDKESIPWGADWEEAMAKGLKESLFLVLILTPDYCRTQWPRLEQMALVSETPETLKKKIRPLLLKECEAELPPFLKSITYMDVSSAEKFEKNYPTISRGLRAVAEFSPENVEKKKFLPLSISTFSTIIKDNYIYVDKTKYIYNLVLKGGAYFLSRPRRFGKSLLISTLKEIFQGHRDLFKGCWIYDRIQWEQYTVLHLDFLGVFYQEDGLEKALSHSLDQLAEEFGLQCEGENSAWKFDDLIRKLAKEKPIVILIDEYDKPITEYIEEVKKAEEHRHVLERFFSVLNRQSENVHFLFITGVTRFTRHSYPLLPDHLIDITFNPDYGQLVGFTHEEIETHFDEYIGEFVLKNAKTVPGYSREAWFAQLKKKYYGYSWDGKQYVYNPISMVYLISFQEFKSSWFSTGSPTLLVRLARITGVDIREWEELVVKKEAFDRFDISKIDLNQLLFQTGYLTIKESSDETYTLSYPNQEVEDGLLYYLVEEFSGQHVYGNLNIPLKKSLEKNDMDWFIDQMKSFFSAIPSSQVKGDVEKYYHLVFYLVLKLAMGKVSPEHFSNRGRMDMVVETDKHIYVLEFKMESASKALKQIQDLGYYEQFLAQPKKIFLMGIGFSAEKRNIADYAHIEINREQKRVGRKK